MTLMEYDVVLTALGDTPLRVIKVVAQRNHWSLPQAHAFLQTCPVCVGQGLTRDQALDWSTSLEQMGGVVNVNTY